MFNELSSDENLCAAEERSGKHQKNHQILTEYLQRLHDDHHDDRYGAMLILQQSRRKLSRQITIESLKQNQFPYLNQLTRE